MSAEPRCPICGKAAAPAEDAAGAPANRAFPFCSGRCKLIDLGNWLDGRYRVAGPSVGEDGEDDEGRGAGELPS